MLLRKQYETHNHILNNKSATDPVTVWKSKEQKANRTIQNELMFSIVPLFQKKCSLLYCPTLFSKLQMVTMVLMQSEGHLQCE